MAKKKSNSDWRGRELAAGRRLIARQRAMSFEDVARWANSVPSAKRVAIVEPDPVEEFFDRDGDVSPDSVAEVPVGLLPELAATSDVRYGSVTRRRSAAPTPVELQKAEAAFRSALEAVSGRLLPTHRQALEAVVSAGAYGGEGAWAPLLEADGLALPGEGADVLYRALSAAYRAADGDARRILARARRTPEGRPFLRRS